MNRLINEFKRLEREKPARSIEELEKRQENLRKKLQEITKELRGIK